MNKKNTPSDDDLAAFLAANPDLKPLKHRAKVVLKKQPTPPLRRRYRDQLNEIETLPLFIDRDEPLLLESDDAIAYKDPSISNKILRKLSKGQYNVEAVLDMHGMTVAVAIREVDAFLKACLETQRQVVLLIHGKGTHQQKPILKNKLHQWLGRVDSVLAFCSAPPAAGHRGALLVLLKRKREE